MKCSDPFWPDGNSETEGSCPYFWGGHPPPLLPTPLSLPLIRTFRPLPHGKAARASAESQAGQTARHPGYWQRPDGKLPNCSIGSERFAG